MVVLERGRSEVPLALDANSIVCSVSELLENRRGVSVALRIDTEVHVGQRFDTAIAVAVLVVVIEVVVDADIQARVGGKVEVVAVAADVVGDTRVCRGREEEEEGEGGR